MTRRWLALAVGLGMLVCPTLSGSADGDAISGPGRNETYQTLAFWLCDSKSSASGNCTEFDLLGSAIGIPTTLQVSIDSTTDCSATPEVDVLGADTSGGDTHTLKSLATDGDSQVFITSAVNRFLSASWSDGAGCTDLDVRMILYYARQ